MASQATALANAVSSFITWDVNMRGYPLQVNLMWPRKFFQLFENIHASKIIVPVSQVFNSTFTISKNPNFLRRWERRNSLRSFIISNKLISKSRLEINIPLLDLDLLLMWFDIYSTASTIIIILTAVRKNHNLNHFFIRLLFTSIVHILISCWKPLFMCIFKKIQWKQHHISDILQAS